MPLPVLDIATYDAYGEMRQSTGGTENAYRFAGEQFDSNVGQYYLRARYYDTSNGRFTGRDSFEGEMTVPLSLAKYPYVHGNPVNRVDFSGLTDLQELTAGDVIATDIDTIDMAKTIKQLNHIYSLGPGSGGGGGSLVRIAALVAAAIFITTALTSDEPPRNNFPYIVWGLEYGVTTVHTYKALRGEGYSKVSGKASSPVLSYRGPGRSYPRTWIDLANPNVPYPCSRGVRRDNLTCDEYPYASTDQGGESNYNSFENVSLALVPKEEQDFQGGNLETFYRNALGLRNAAMIDNNNRLFGVIADIQNEGSYYVDSDNIRHDLAPVPIYRGGTKFSFTAFESAYFHLNP